MTNYLFISNNFNSFEFMCTANIWLLELNSMSFILELPNCENFILLVIIGHSFWKDSNIGIPKPSYNEGKTNKSKSTLTGDFLFKKKDKKESSDNNEERPEVVNKEALA